jgi:hypothetical protein
MAWADIRQWALISAAAAVFAFAIVPASEPEESADATVFDQIGDSEIPNRVVDDLLVIAADAVVLLISTIVD